MADTDSPPPNGALHDAWKLLRSNRTDEGRAMLRTLCERSPQDFDAHVLAAFEYLRPPENRPESSRLLQIAETILPESSEVNSMMAIGLFNKNYQTSFEAFGKASRIRPRTAHGSAILLLARLCLSDLLIQASYRPIGSDISVMLVNAVVKGAALLILRRKQEALETFRAGIADASTMPAVYEKTFQFTLEEEARENVVQGIQTGCVLGIALTMRDMGLVEDARNQWRNIATLLPNVAEIVGPLCAED